MDGAPNPESKDVESSSHDEGNSPAQCGCLGDPFAGVPSEARPDRKPSAGGLRHATCPDCGLVYWTNRATDLCMECAQGRTP